MTGVLRASTLVSGVVLQRTIAMKFIWIRMALGAAQNLRHVTLKLAQCRYANSTHGHSFSRTGFSNSNFSLLLWTVRNRNHDPNPAQTV